MDSSLILGYWNMRGLAEPIRLLLEYLDFSYTEDKYTDQNDKKRWLEIVKPKMASPFPNLPYLIDNSRVITETDAILFYIANKKGRKDLFGLDFEEKLQVLQIRGVLTDISRSLSDLLYNSNYNDNLKDECLKEDGPLMKKLDNIHKYLEGKDFLMGSNVKYVDFFFYENLECLRKLNAKMMEKYERFNTYSERFRKLHGIEAYLKSERFSSAKQFANPIHSICKI